MMRIFSQQDPEHCETMALLPWFLNGTLEASERHRVEHHLLECIVCRREVERERAVRDAVFADARDESWRPSFARVGSRIDAMDRDARVRPARRPLRESWRAMAPWVRGAIAAQVLLVCVLAAGWYRSSDQPAFRTLGASPSTVAHDTVLVVFDAAATERDIRRVLLAEKARVTAGPSPDGAYTLQVDNADADAVLARLRKSSVVRFAERGAPPGAER